MNKLPIRLKLSEEKIKILKEEGTIFIDHIEGKKYYQFPKQVYMKTEDESIFELVDRIMTPIELPSDEEMANASNHFKDGQVKAGFLRGVLWYQEQILNQNK